MAAAVTVMAFTPFIDWGKFLPRPWTDIPKRASPDGSQANIKTFPVNHSEVIIYPKTDDKHLEHDNLLDYQKSLVVVKMLYLRSERTVLYAYIFGVWKWL